MVMSAIAAMLLAGASSAPVTVEIVASGHIETPAQKYRLAASLDVCATSQAAADRLLASKSATIDAGLRAIGVGPAAALTGGLSLPNLISDMRPGKSSASCPAPDMAIDAAASATDEDHADTKEEAAEFGASRSFSLDAPNAAAVEKAIALLAANGAKPGDKAIPMLTDEVGAKRAAKQQALNKARAEADSYAALLGGKAVLTRISERQELGQQSLDFMSQIFRMFAKGGGSAPDSVATDVTITVEFALDGAR
ncbi:SIMPL domain-containing protein [Sphingomonas hylomeconis]|uniref:SIMPL domain-containing protein n=1 Tax=Sphingomonas hylomeconis TaxID=1395958 RepID=A0ABV7SVH4_9SPHN|nr:SIMPL domain-containing protein [Sphingomonas hylomeconis]